MKRSSGLNFYRKKKKVNKKLLVEIIIWLAGVLITIFVAFVCVFSFGIKTSIIGDSMYPTLENGQEIFVDRLRYILFSPKRGDVIVFTPDGNENSHFYVKRVIGLPGETVQIKDGRVYIDGELFEEDMQFYDLMEDAGIAENVIVLSKDEYFVLGDNRNSSEDSRNANIGIIKKDNIYAKAWLHMSGDTMGIGIIH